MCINRNGTRFGELLKIKYLILSGEVLFYLKRIPVQIKNRGNNVTLS